MPRSHLMRFQPLALALLVGCGDGGGPTTAVDEDVPAGFELVSASEIADTRFLEDLTEEDRAAVRETLQAARAEIRSILARLREGEIDREAARALVEHVHQRLLETLSQLLTEEQIDRLLHPRGGDDRPDLDLRERQLPAIRALREECQHAVLRVKEAVESGGITALEGRRRVRRIAYHCRRELCGILEPRQQAKVPFCREPQDESQDG
ncbi:MAG: hypothetical protein ACREMD_03070 [Gemmatimonadota bacterium]